jgi:tripartite-type tricarboxylate transporter receptor subunit TctC
MTKDRSPVLPNLPTTGEQGSTCRPIPGAQLLLPKGAPPAWSRKLNEAAVAGHQYAIVQERMKAWARRSPSLTRRARMLGKFIESESRNGKRRSRRAE